MKETKVQKNKTDKINKIEMPKIFDVRIDFCVEKKKTIIKHYLHNSGVMRVRGGNEGVEHSFYF